MKSIWQKLIEPFSLFTKITFFSESNIKTLPRFILLVRMTLGKILHWLRFPVNPIWLPKRSRGVPPFRSVQPLRLKGQGPDYVFVIFVKTLERKLIFKRRKLICWFDNHRTPLKVQIRGNMFFSPTFLKTVIFCEKVDWMSRCP